MTFLFDAEEWRAVPSFPGLFASSRGRIKGSTFEGKMPRNGVRTYHPKPWAGSWDGERFIFNFRGKNGKVARAVCEAFHGPAPFERAVVMHLDENSRNNAPANLRWGTQKENLNAPGFLAYCRGRTGVNNPFLKGRARIPMETAP